MKTMQEQIDSYSPEKKAAVLENFQKLVAAMQAKKQPQQPAKQG